jgi:membrane protease YdiL (CAAX protease family)
MTANWKRVALFFGVTFGLTHALSIGYVCAAGSWGTPTSYAVANVLMLCPTIAALGLQRLVFSERILVPLGLLWRPNGWFLVAWVLPPLVILAALGVSLLLPAARYAPNMGGLPPEMDSFRRQVASLGAPPIVGMLALGLALGPTLNAIGGLGEEIGWRGFMYKELAPLGFWRCSLATGAFWAAWHVPLLLEGYGDREHPVAGALGMIAFAVLLAPILHLVRSRSGSVVACGILHGTMSSTRLVSVAFVRDAGPWANAAIPALLLLADGILLIADPQGRRLAGTRSPKDIPSRHQQSVRPMPNP